MQDNNEHNPRIIRDVLMPHVRCTHGQRQAIFHRLSNRHCLLSVCVSVRNLSARHPAPLANHTMHNSTKCCNPLIRLHAPSKLI
jgi:hypothetical protein